MYNRKTKNDQHWDIRVMGIWVIYNGGFDRENSYWRVLYQSGSTINTKVSN